MFATKKTRPGPGSRRWFGARRLSRPGLQYTLLTVRSKPVTTDAEMKNNYLAALRDAEKELAGIDSRRSALQATIASLSRLVDADKQLEMGIQSETNESIPPKIPPDFFKGKKPTQAYRDFVRLWGENHSVPEIRDALFEGGIEAKSKNWLLAALHSVVAREKKKKKKEGEAAS